MNKKLREKLDSSDLKSLIVTIIIFLIGASLLYYFSDFRNRLRENDKEKFKGQTIGEIISIEPIQRMSQGRLGNNIYIDNYKISYKYKVNTVEYTQINFIPFASIENQRFVKNIINRSPKESFLVKFDLENPSKSILIEKP